MTQKNSDETMTDHSLLKFPCDFPIKIIGKATPELHQAVLKILTEYVPNFNPNTVTINKSSAGNYNALTAIIYAQNQAQLDIIYQALTDNDLVLMAL